MIAMRGISITVKKPLDGTLDRFGNPIKTWQTFTIDDVLVSPGATADLEASRPEGVSVAWTLHIPKTFVGTLEGCEITLPEPYGGRYRVIGNPGQYMDENTPTRWHTPVEIEAAHG